MTLESLLFVILPGRNPGYTSARTQVLGVFVLAPILEEKYRKHH
jgi:hypothetical protein